MVQQFRAFKEKQCTKIASVNVFAFIIFFVLVSIYALINHPTELIEPLEEQWYLSGDSRYEVDIGWHEMWDVYCSIPSSQKNTVRIAIIDTGVDADNPEIKESVIKTKIVSSDKIGHGTKVAGIICASQYAGRIVGISDIKKTKIIPIKLVLETDGIDKSPCDVEDLAKAIRLADSLGCSICNISLNTNTDSKIVKDAIEDSDMLFVVSAGNGEIKGRNIDNYPSYPASYDIDNLITVTNVKSNGRLNSTANFGQCVDIAAPGTEIYNLDIDNGYCAATGTSFATPVVTGLAAMLYICDEKMTAEQCKAIILRSSTKEMRLEGKIQSGRIVNLDASLRSTVK